MPVHAEIEPLLAPYALGALPDEAIEEVEEHLAECETCRDEFDAHLRLNAYVGLVAPQVEPPSGLRDRLMTAVRAESAAPPHLEVLPRPAAQEPRPTPIPLFSMPWRRPRGVPVYWAAVAALIPLAVSGWLFFQVLSLKTSMAAMQLSMRETWTNAENVTEIMGRGIVVGAGTAQVVGTDLAPTAGGMLYYLPNQQEGVLVVDALPTLPKGQCYQVWLYRGDQAVSGGTFYLGGDGRGIAPVKSPMRLTEVELVRVTMEPHGGSDQPSDGKRYLWARLSRT